MRNWLFPLLMGCVIFCTYAVRADDTAIEARDAFAEGKLAYQNQAYIEAAEAFQKAYKLKPSWRLHFNIAQANTAGKRYGLALDAFHRYLVEGGDDVTMERQKYVSDEIERLRPLVGFITVAAPRGAVVYVDGIERGTAPLNREISVAASVSHTIHVTVAGRALPAQTLEVLGERTATVQFNNASSQVSEETAAHLTPASSEIRTGTDIAAATKPSSRSPLHRSRLTQMGRISVGVGAALLVGGAITGSQALKRDGDLESSCDRQVCYEDSYETLDERHRLATATTLLFAAGIVATSAGIVLLVVNRKKETSSPLTILPGPTGLVLSGSF